MNATSFVATALAAALLFAPAPAHERFHELQDNRATLALRDRTHVSVTLYLNYTDALHRALAPDQSMRDFVLAYAALPPAELLAALRKAQERFQHDTHLQRAAGRDIPLGNWKWPDLMTVQDLLRQQAMAAIAAPSDHAHEEPLEIRAEGVAAQPITTATVRFPLEFQRVLVVSYKPNQAWVEPAGPPTVVVF